MPADPAMSQAISLLEKASRSEKIRRLVFQREFAMTKMLSQMEEKRKEGQAEGLAEGEAKARTDIVLRMLQKNVPLADIVDLSGLSEADIKRLAAEKKA